MWCDTMTWNKLVRVQSNASHHVIMFNFSDIQILISDYLVSQYLLWKLPQRCIGLGEKRWKSRGDSDVVRPRSLTTGKQIRNGRIFKQYNNISWKSSCLCWSSIHKVLENVYWICFILSYEIDPLTCINFDIFNKATFTSWSLETNI